MELEWRPNYGHSIIYNRYIILYVYLNRHIQNIRPGPFLPFIEAFLLVFGVESIFTQMK